MEHPAFTEAGNQAGIEIWTIDQFEPVPIDQQMYGKFYNGDAYIVLKTTGDDSLAYDAHFWLGANSTQDKQGSAAILTVTLDDMLKGKAVHHREVQGHESSLFLRYFNPAIRYLEGGNESGFNQVETNAGAEKRLLKLTGCDNMRIQEVPAEASSLTRNHCFILEVEHDIFVLMPEGAKATQRRKIISVANTLRDDYHNGRATIEIIDEFSSDDDVSQFFEALGSGSKADLVDDDSSVDTYARESMSAVYLYKVLLGDSIELVALNKPYKQKHLASDEIYILDTPCSGVYIWIGAGASADSKKNYNNIVQQYLEIKGYPIWVPVTRISEGAESSNFKQYFHNWDTVCGSNTSFFVAEADAGYFSSDPEEVAAIAYQIGKSASARGYMPDAGDGSLQVTRIAGGDTEDISGAFDGVVKLYQSEVYVVKYQYTDGNGEDGYVIYLWVGAQATEEDKTVGLKLASELEDDLGTSAAFVKVPQGKEPKHFLSLFKGNLAILIGSKVKDYQPENSKGSYGDDNIRLFRVEGTQTGVDIRAVQVEETAAVLEDDDVYVLETKDVVYVRNGKESDPQEREAALTFVQEVVGDAKELSVIAQGDETDAFWDALGGAPEEKEDNSGWKTAASRRVTTPPSLYDVTVTVTGKIKFEDLSPNFTQQDLSDDGLYILDVGEELYLWEGAAIPERARRARVDIIKEYIEDDGLDRSAESTLVVGLKQGREPGVFKKYFPDWDGDMWTNQTSYNDLKSETKESNSQ